MRMQKAVKVRFVRRGSESFPPRGQIFGWISRYGLISTLEDTGHGRDRSRNTMNIQPILGTNLLFGFNIQKPTSISKQVEDLDIYFGLTLGTKTIQQCFKLIHAAKDFKIKISAQKKQRTKQVGAIRGILGMTSKLSQHFHPHPPRPRNQWPGSICLRLLSQDKSDVFPWI